MDIQELKSSLEACEEILDELPQNIGRSIVETEENQKFLEEKLESEKAEIEEEIQNYQETNQMISKEKNALKRQLIEIEKNKMQKESEKNKRGPLKEKDLNALNEDRELEDELNYHGQMISYLKSKINLYRMCAKIEWDLESQDVSGKIVKKDYESMFRLQNKSAFDMVNDIWELID